MVQLF